VNPIVTAVVVFAGLFVVSRFVAGKAVSRFSFALSKIDVSYAGLVPILTLSILVRNPTPTTVRVNRIEGDIYVNGEYVAQVSNYKGISIAAQGETIYPIDVELLVNAIVRELMDVLRGALSKPIYIRFDGTAVIEDISIPIDVTHKLLPEKLLI
jgi:LEA14-like dessication related protein